MTEDGKRRSKEVIKSILILLGIGMLYAFFTTVTGFRIPCIINRITGFYCPGCGVTRMCLSLLRFDFALAFRCNQLLFLSLPLLAGIIVRLLYRYIRYGTAKAEPWINCLLVLLIICFLVFGVIRNLPGMEVLCPPEFF